MPDFEQYKDEIRLLLKQYEIKHASLFGSFSKGEEHAHSDIDLLIETGENFTLFDMLALEDNLQALTHRKVDLVEYSAIKSSIKERVLKEAVQIL
jgi:predicted nucleotidyltransferase